MPANPPDSSPHLSPTPRGQGASPPAAKAPTSATLADPPPLNRWLGGLAFSNVLPGLIGAALTSAGAAALGVPDSLRWAAIAASGAFVIYGLDRLRDTPRDRESSPLRTAFTQRNARPLTFALGLAGAGLTALIVSSPAEVAALCGIVGAIGLFHRRLKGNRPAKTLYVAAAWTAICAVSPWLGAQGHGADLLGQRAVSHGGPGGPSSPLEVAWVSGIFFCALWSNVIAANLDESASPKKGPPLGSRTSNTTLFRGRGLTLARAAAVLGIMIAAVAPAALCPLIWIPTAEAIALAGFRPSEHYEHLVIDGALLVGSLVALIHFWVIE